MLQGINLGSIMSERYKTVQGVISSTTRLNHGIIQLQNSTTFH